MSYLPVSATTSLSLLLTDLLTDLLVKLYGYGEDYIVSYS